VTNKGKGLTITNRLHPLMNDEWLHGASLRQHKDEISRINRFLNWMEDNNLTWIEVNLADYRDHLSESGLSIRSIGSILPTIRKSYSRALADNSVRSMLREQCRQELEERGVLVGPADLKAVYDTLLETIENNISPLNSSISMLKVADEEDATRTWLTEAQVIILLTSPKRDTLKGLRDQVLLSLLVGMGLRESEVCNLTVSDINVLFGNEPALRVAIGKGRKKRLVPYGAQVWIIRLVEEWLEKAGINGDDSLVMRGLHSSSRYVLHHKMSTRSVQKIVSKYRPDGIKITPHDLRRTYARLMYMSGMDLERISQNMGHASIETTRRSYIGTLSVEDRSPGLLFDSPL